MEYREYSVSARHKEPLLRFLLEGFRKAGCQIIKASEPNMAPFRITIETPSSERIGLVCYAFLANSRRTRNRPEDEHRFQVKYGSKDGKLLRPFQDPFGLYTTMFLGINSEDGFLVGADPAMHSPSKLFISVEFKQEHADKICRAGWHAWERSKIESPLSEPVEVLVGCKQDRLLDYVRFERMAQGLDQGNRQLLAEKLASGKGFRHFSRTAPTPVPIMRPPHELAKQLDLSEAEILDLIASARRLKMAVRGWVAEEHLTRALRAVRGVTECQRLDVEGGADVSLRFRGSRPLTLQCKNVLRDRAANGAIRLDFQKTRASKGDPCSRYYRQDEFAIAAACLHSVTERWEFRYALPSALDPHKSCCGRIAQNVRIDGRWMADARTALAAAANS